LTILCCSAVYAQPSKSGSPFDQQTVKVEKNIPYAATKDPRQALDVYLPRAPKSDKPLPVVVNIHGGAFRMGDKNMGVREIAALVASGDYAAVSINYRLSGQAIWPAQIHDCKAAIRWVRANARKYNFDPENVGVIGGSAGGHLVAMLGTSGGVPALEGDVGPYQGTSSKVKCVVDQFGPSDLLAMGGSHDSPESAESLLIGGPLQENKDAARAASPIRFRDTHEYGKVGLRKDDDGPELLRRVVVGLTDRGEVEHRRGNAVGRSAQPVFTAAPVFKQRRSGARFRGNLDLALLIGQPERPGNLGELFLQGA